MWQPENSDDFAAAVDRFNRLIAPLQTACDILCVLAITGALALFVYHGARFALRVLA